MSRFLKVRSASCPPWPDAMAALCVAPRPLLLADRSSPDSRVPRGVVPHVDVPVPRGVMLFARGESVPLKSPRLPDWLALSCSSSALYDFEYSAQ